MGKEDEEMEDVGLAKESDWSSYQHLLEPLKEKKRRVGARIKNLFGGVARSKGWLCLLLNQFTTSSLNNDSHELLFLLSWPSNSIHTRRRSHAKS